MSTVNIEALVKAGKTPEEIAAIVKAEATKITAETTKAAVVNPEVVAVGKKLVAGGTPSIAEAVLVVIETVKAEMPTVKTLLVDEVITLDELKGLEDELKPVIAMYDGIIKMALDMGMTKEDLLKSSPSKGGNMSSDQLTDILKGLSR